jgi:spoIIIJ-associated protein
MKDQIQEIGQELMGKMGIEAQVKVSEDKAEDGQKVFMVAIDSPREAGLLIGAHGATLHAIQSFLAMAIKQKTGEWVRVVVDIGEWRQKHDEHLVGLAQQAAERAKQTGEVQTLYNLTPAQRRVVHLALSKEKGIVTESEGEGEGRYLVVKPV